MERDNSQVTEFCMERDENKGISRDNTVTYGSRDENKIIETTHKSQSYIWREMRTRL